LNKRVAIIGSGISGTSAAYYLQRAGYKVSLFEAGNYFGGHTNTVDINLDGKTFPVDTGFLVHNDRTYPNLVPFFEELGVEVQNSDMSFSSQHLTEQIYWAGTDLNTVFAQRKNLLNPRFYRFLKEIMRFNGSADTYLHGCKQDIDITLGDLLNREGFTSDFRNWYLLPMGGSIWSTPTAKMLEFPAYTFLQFCMNHGLLQLTDRPQWKTVTNGCKTYVSKALAKVQHKYLNEPVVAIQSTLNGLLIQTKQRAETFDKCVICTHPPQTMEMLGEGNETVKSVLRRFEYQPNTAVLHTDASVLPPKRAWSAWNYTAANNQNGDSCVSVTYLINMLQPLPTEKPVLVTLNPVTRIEPEKIIKTISYDHPLFDLKAVKAQSLIHNIQGHNGMYLAGAWLRYGFHEDGIISAKWAVNQLLKDDGLSEYAIDVK
jgi:predicted NAD/FAD-binding protein